MGGSPDLALKNEIGERLNLTSEGLRPLSGIKVLELGRLVAAPLCGQILADLGADVVKVEHPEGDEYRRYGPNFLKDKEGRNTKESSGFLSNNRNKRSIAVDLTTPEGAQIVRKLAEDCDVFIENFKVGALVKYGLDRDSIRQLNPQVIYVSVTGYGQTGPYADRPATDGAVQAMSGLQSLTGDPSGPPQRVGVLMADIMTGIYSALAAVAALRHREVNSGGGQAIDMALLDCAMAAVGTAALEYRLSGEPPRRYGNGQPGAVPSQAYACTDGFIQIQAAFDAHFVRLCGAFGIPEVAQDPRFVDRHARVRHKDELNEILIPLFATRSVKAADALLSAADLICSPINDVPTALKDPHVVHRGIELKLPHQAAGQAPSIANPMRFSDTPIRYDSGPPAVGQHTDEVLAQWAGLGADAIAELRDRKAVAG
jgi:crotonobetainyl-CoA:carnitine CoA-transferase CaiB-like acyl-CoA transferase